MDFTLDEIGKTRQRWVALQGHLAPMEILVEFMGTEARQRFVNRLESEGVLKPTRDNPLRVAMGREGTFFNALAASYVRDWRNVKARAEDEAEAPYDQKKMGEILRHYPAAYETLMNEVAKEDAFFVSGANGSMPS